MENKVLILGSINTDFFVSTEKFPQQGETVLGHHFFTTLGGKGCNQASVLAKLGIQTYFVGCVGNDSFAKQALNTMKEIGINVDFVNQNKKAPTGSAIIIQHDSDNRIIVNSGANQFISIDQLKKAIDLLNPKVFATQFEVPIHVVEESIVYAKKKGLITVVNPSPVHKINKEILKSIDYLILNHFESLELSGVDINDKDWVEKIATYFLKSGVKNIIVTLGKEGCLYINSEKTQKIQAFTVEVVDTTGAGDAFLGGVIYGLVKQKEPLDLLLFGSAAGTITCMTHGAQSKMLSLENIEKIIKGENHG